MRRRSETGHLETISSVLGFQQPAQIELLDQLLHVAFGRRAQLWRCSFPSQAFHGAADGRTSRSVETYLSRDFSLSDTINGMARVMTLAKTEKPMRMVIIIRGSSMAEIIESTVLIPSGMPDQKSKLIILRMTMTPVNIHSAEPASIIWPSSVVQSSEM